MLPNHPILARWNARLSSSLHHGIVAIALVVSPIACDLFNLVLNLVEEVAQDLPILEISRGDDRCHDFASGLIHPQVQFAPRSTFADAMVSGLPFSLSIDLHPGRIHNHIDGFVFGNNG